VPVFSNLGIAEHQRFPGAPNLEDLGAKLCVKYMDALLLLSLFHQIGVLFRGQHCRLAGATLIIHPMVSGRHKERGSRRVGYDLAKHPARMMDRSNLPFR
jgi:hypothetical protein